MSWPSLDGLRAVLFDFDGTLMDSFASHIEAYLEMFARLGLEVSSERLLQVYTPDWLQVYRALALPERLWQQADAYWLEAASRHRPELFPGVPAMLDTLSRRYALAIVTSGERHRILGDVARTAIGGYFEAIVTGDDVTRPKPDPEGLQIALARLDVLTGEAVYVGDTAADRDMALAAGVPFVGIEGPMLPEGVDHRLRGPDLLVQVLDIT
jgi:HAD superfamily hydrolase (TIGR01549 family)